MRLLYNYTTTDYSVYSDEREDVIIKNITTIYDAYSVYDISHWTGEDLMEFAKQSPEEQVGQLEGLKEI